MTQNLDPIQVVCIIPARGGSKGIRRKNVRLVGGKPLLAYSIEAAHETSSIGRVIVSTDDEEIADVARQYHAEVIDRPAEISGDNASSESALLHALDHLKTNEGYEPDLVVFLQPTSPLRSRHDIGEAVETLWSQKADSLFSTAPIHGFIWRKNADSLSPISYDPVSRPQRQDIEETFMEENGSIYVFRPWVLTTSHSRLGGKVAVHEMDPLNSFQVDTPSDLDLMEGLMVITRPATKQHDLSTVRLLVLDFDGVLTDNRVAVAADGRESVWCHRGDSLGIARLKEAGVEVAVLSTETDKVVSARCRKLDVECHQGLDDKLPTLQRMVANRFLRPDEVAYVGNDVNDLGCLRWVGVPIVVADAEPEVRGEFGLVTNRTGGHGAVREVARWILSARSA